MIKTMKKRMLNTMLLATVIAVALGFVFQQVEKKNSQKPKWEQETGEEARRILQQNPDLYNDDDPYAEFIVRVSRVGMGGFWKEELRHPDAKKRAWALRIATPEILSAETAIPAIMPLLEDKSAHVRFEAAAALLRFDSEQGVGVLLDLLKEPGDSPASEVISVLIRYERTEAVPILRELFEKAMSQREARRDNIYPANYVPFLAKALGAFNDRESHSLFEQYFRFGSVEGFRPLDSSVVEAAGQLVEPRLTGSLQEVFNRSKDLGVKLAAAFGLAKLGDESALTYLMKQVFLLRGMPEWTLIQQDSEGRPTNVNNPAFAQWSAGKPPVEGIFSAVLYLGELKAVRAIPLLIELTTAENVSLVRTTIKSLTLLGDKRAVPVLVKLTRPDHPLRYEAARALVFFDDPEAEQAVRRLYPQEQDRAKLIRQAKEQGPAEFIRP
jgi:HEAT repeat protein